jgi:ABC-2 type transport system permease protein
VSALALRQTAALAHRSVSVTLRQPDAWFPGIFFPLVLLAIFSASFGQAPGRIAGFPQVHGFLDFALAGAVLQGAISPATGAAAAFATDIEGGFLDRLVASPASRAALLGGRLAGAAAIAVAQTAVFVAVALGFGVRAEGGVEGLLALGATASLVAVAVGGLGVVLALRTGSAEAVQATFPLYFALIFFSSAFFPRETMDGWFRVVADVNPISHLVEGMRAGIIGGAEGGSAALALAIAAGLAALGLAGSGLALRGRLRRGS